MTRTTLSDIILSLQLPHDIRILDVACGTGNISRALKEAEYDNLDGLDPISGYLNVDEDLFQQTFPFGLEPNKRIVAIEDESYDLVMMAAGLFPGLVSPLAMPELLRMTRKDGLIVFNVCENFREMSGDVAKLQIVVDQLIESGCWKHVLGSPRFVGKMVFSDSGAACLGNYINGGAECPGFVFIMRKIKHILQ